MIRHILFLVESTFTQRDFARFGIDLLVKDGFKVSVFDYTPFLHPLHHLHVTIPDPSAYPGIRTYTDKKAALKDLSVLDNSSTYVVCVIPYSLRSLAIYKALTNEHLSYCVLRLGSLPSFHHAKDSASPSFLNKLRRLKLSSIPDRIFDRVPYRWARIRPASHLLADGGAALPCNYPLDEKSKVIWAHSLDYDVYLNTRKAAPDTKPSNTVVFLDEYLPFHPDYFYQGSPPPCTPDQYYPMLNKFFDFLEHQHGVTVQIAAHPRSAYETSTPHFGNRPVVINKTAELVKNSKFVLLHSSTSITYAVMFKKPVVFLTMDCMERHASTNAMVAGMAREFGKTPISLNEPFQFEMEKHMAIDADSYDRYRQSFIKKDGTPDAPIWRIFADELKRSEFTV